jgi:aminoglycoside phosphotransferase (APT) family kinase protein
MNVDKSRPSEAWIAQLRARFTTEREIDRVLTRKLRRRAGPAYAPLPLERLVEGVSSLLDAELNSPFELRNARWLSGGASKLQMAFELEWQDPQAGLSHSEMVLRMEPSESIVETSRRREFQLIRAMEGVVPVPPVYWCDAEGDHLPYPALIYGFAPGVTKPSAAASGVSGLGTRLPAALRKKLAPQFVDHLAKIHTADFTGRALDAFEVPQAGTTQCAEWGIDWWARVWEEDADEDVPLMRLATCWLREHAPVLDRAVIVHSDYRLGNFLYTEHDTTITAWLDWELGRIGDRHQDLAWTTSRAFGALAEDGKTFLTSGLLPEPEFLAAYEQATGQSVNTRTLHWYQVYNAWMMATLALATGYRAARGGKTHQDVLVTWLIGIGPMLLDEMRTLIETEI